MPVASTDLNQAHPRAGVVICFLVVVQSNHQCHGPHTFMPTCAAGEFRELLLQAVQYRSETEVQAQPSSPGTRQRIVRSRTK